jgi:hypothetical protein
MSKSTLDVHRAGRVCVVLLITGEILKDNIATHTEKDEAHIIEQNQY